MQHMTCVAIQSLTKPITRFQRLPKTHGSMPCVFSFALPPPRLPQTFSRQPKLFLPIPGLVSCGRLLPDKFPSGNPPLTKPVTPIPPASSRLGFPQAFSRQPKLFTPHSAGSYPRRLLPNKFPSGNPPCQSQLPQFSQPFPSRFLSPPAPSTGQRFLIQFLLNFLYLSNISNNLLHRPHMHPRHTA